MLSCFLALKQHKDTIPNQPHKNNTPKTLRTTKIRADCFCKAQINALYFAYRNCHLIKHMPNHRQPRFWIQNTFVHYLFAKACQLHCNIIYQTFMKNRYAHMFVKQFYHHLLFAHQNPLNRCNRHLKHCLICQEDQNYSKTQHMFRASMCISNTAGVFNLTPNPKNINITDKNLQKPENKKTKLNCQFESKIAPSSGDLGKPCYPCLSKHMVTKLYPEQVDPKTHRNKHSRTPLALVNRKVRFRELRKERRKEFRNLTKHFNPYVPKVGQKWIKGKGTLKPTYSNPRESYAVSSSLPRTYVKTKQLIKNQIKELICKLRHNSESNKQNCKTAVPIKINNQPKYLHTLNLCTINIRNIKETEKLEMTTKYLQEHNIDICCFQETYVNTNSHFKKDKYLFIFSTGISDKAREEATKNKNGKGKSKGNQKRGNQIDQERAGVGFAIKLSLLPLIQDIHQHNGRNISLHINDSSGKILLVNTYCPHALYPLPEKEKHYNDIKEILKQGNKYCKVIVAGDFNCRLQGPLEDELEFIGREAFGPGADNIENLSTQTIENRDLFVNLCIDQDLCAKTTFFRKQIQYKVTFRCPGTNHGPPWTHDRYQQLDFFLISNKWKNSIKDAWSDSDACIYSDHYPLHATLFTKIKKSKQEAYTPKYWPPNQEQIKDYNKTVNILLKKDNCEHKSDFSEHCKTAAHSCFDMKPPEVKKSYISKETWEKLRIDKRHLKTLSTMISVNLLKKLDKLLRLTELNPLLNNLRTMIRKDQIGKLFKI